MLPSPIAAHAMTRTQSAARSTDHATGLALGCEGVLNMPVRWRSETVGTLNLLHRAEHCTEAHIPHAALLAHLALPAFTPG